MSPSFSKGVCILPGWQRFWGLQEALAREGGCRRCWGGCPSPALPGTWTRHPSASVQPGQMQKPIWFFRGNEALRQGPRSASDASLKNHCAGPIGRKSQLHRAHLKTLESKIETGGRAQAKSLSDGEGIHLAPRQPGLRKSGTEPWGKEADAPLVC